ncbi:N-acetyltransferase [Novymonas esmeraldas]|uniref:N-acetyltransferase n=1 Tax=Novymonas esmeraldas TaxID=1808958 RepID=A0AAW0EXI7_9TRYP
MAHCPFPRQAYYERIGAATTLLPLVTAHEASEQSATPGALGIDFVRSLMLAHLSTIPFENVDAVLGRPISMALADILDKMIHAGRGGYCHEHNSLMRAALVDAGFTHIRTLGARAAISDEQAPVGRVHVMNMITVPCMATPGTTERWLVDVGTSAGVPMAPLQLEHTGSQFTPAGEFRVTQYDLCTSADMMAAARPAGGHDEGWVEYALEMFSHSGVWRAVHRFDLQPQYPRDVFAINYIVYTISPLVHSLRGSRTVVQWAEPGEQKVAHDVGGAVCVPRGVYSLFAADNARVSTRTLNAYPGMQDAAPATGRLAPLEPTESHPGTPGELYDWMVEHLHIDFAQTRLPEYTVTRDQFIAAAHARLAVFGGAEWRAPVY